MPTLDTLGVAAFAALLTAALLRGVLGARARLRPSLEETELQHLASRIREAESRTTAEIVPMVVGSSEDHPDARLRAAWTMLVLGSVLLAGTLPWDSPALVLLSQAALALLGYGLAWTSPEIERAFVSNARADSVCEEQAAIEFAAQGVGRTRDGHGVLLFVSCFERRVVVLADEGVARDAAETLDWRPTRDAILTGLREGSLAEALEAGIDAAGAALATVLPGDATDPNELPDRVILEDA